eukprot:1145039-Pelagomonas_calceolata.AAC.3
MGRSCNQKLLGLYEGKLQKPPRARFVKNTGMLAERQVSSQDNWKEKSTPARKAACIKERRDALECSPSLSEITRLSFCDSSCVVETGGRQDPNGNLFLVAREHLPLSYRSKGTLAQTLNIYQITLGKMTNRHNDDLFRRLSAFAQDDEKRDRQDDVMRITQGRTYLYKQLADVVLLTSAHWLLNNAGAVGCRAAGRASRGTRPSYAPASPGHHLL